MTAPELAPPAEKPDNLTLYSLLVGRLLQPHTVYLDAHYTSFHLPATAETAAVFGRVSNYPDYMLQAAIVHEEAQRIQNHTRYTAGQAPLPQGLTADDQLDFLRQGISYLDISAKSADESTRLAWIAVKPGQLPPNDPMRQIAETTDHDPAQVFLYNLHSRAALASPFDDPYLTALYHRLR